MSRVSRSLGTVIMENQVLTPHVYWAQRHRELYLRVELSDVQVKAGSGGREPGGCALVPSGTAAALPPCVPGACTAPACSAGRVWPAACRRPCLDLRAPQVSREPGKSGAASDCPAPPFVRSLGLGRSLSPARELLAVWDELCGLYRGVTVVAGRPELLRGPRAPWGGVRGGFPAVLCWRSLLLLILKLTNPSGSTPAPLRAEQSGLLSCIENLNIIFGHTKRLCLISLAP